VRNKLNFFIASVIFSIILWGSISLSDIYYTNIEVNLSLTNFPEGYTTGSQFPETVKLRVKGQGWRLVSLNVGPEGEFVVSVGSDSGSKVINLYDYLESNRWLISDVEIMSIQPDSIKFFVERVISKKLPVQPNLDLNYKPGFGLATEINISPDSVKVFGPVSKLRRMNKIETENKTFASLDSKVESEVSLINRKGFSYNNNTINVVLDVQKIVDKQFDNLTVEVRGIPHGKEVVLLPNKIGFNVRGGIEILGKLKQEQFTAYVNYRTLVNDTTGSVIPVLEMPKNVTLQYLKPERLRYIIRSF
jgi:hypothetical protein